MTKINSSLPVLQQCIRDELLAMTSFAKILKLEQAALIEGDTDQLGKITEEKSLIIKQLTELEKIRKTSLVEAGFDTDLNGMEAYLSKLDASDNISGVWFELMEISKQAKEFNRTNGLLINRHLNRNQAALNILHRKDPSANLYGPNGQSTNKSVTGRGFLAG